MMRASSPVRVFFQAEDGIGDLTVTGVQTCALPICLLFAGTERGVSISFDDGASWQSLQQKLPIVPIADMLVRDDALIAATRGRSFWMIDDIDRKSVV